MTARSSVVHTMKGYSTQEVSDLIELPESVIRDIARGVLDLGRDPNHHFRFSFQDLVILRTAKELINSGVQRSKINRSLTELRKQLPSNRPLTALRISGDGGSVVIHHKNQVYNPESGQIHFDFSASELAGTVAPMARKAAENAEALNQLSSDDWFDLGVDLEAVSPADAPDAYNRALSIEPDHADAHVNMGRLLQEAGKFDAAEEHYYQALESEPDNSLAAFNLGTLLEDTGHIHDAIEAYKKAASFADAHYNLSRLYELVGQHTKALKHLRTYRNLLES
ncbi:MAG: tetratricopeptide repeat protein [Pseudomonadales bacterium]|nr:tetratricopeptide repeat protein [Pseudomonadales bacterium]